MSPEYLFTLLLDAQRAEIGVALTTSDPSRLRQRFYSMMREQDIDNITLRIPSTPGELWLIRKNSDSSDTTSFSTRAISPD